MSDFHKITEGRLSGMDIHSWWYPLSVILLNMADQLKFRLKNEALFREQRALMEGWPLVHQQLLWENGGTSVKNGCH